MIDIPVASGAFRGYPTVPETLPHLLQLHHHASHDFCYRVGDTWLGLVAARAEHGNS